MQEKNSVQWRQTGHRRQPAAQAGEPPIVAVFDGQRCVGHVLRRGTAGFEAFDADNRSLGTYLSQREAAVPITGVR